ncbi:MAG: hypothetical protein JWM28_2945 [Chitinophagaceae bacterium]|nr:hypothetical protein [Chitinophagaceae bacterium]
MLISIHNTSFEQSKTGIENYQYMADRSVLNLVALVHHTTKKNLYTELRYNYEDLNTVSVYVGKTLFIKGNSDFSFSPMAGLVMGKYTGGSLAMNTDFEYKKIFFSSQAQYTISNDDKANSFFYNWSELLYYTRPWFFTGITIQQTWLCEIKMKTVTGLLAGFKKNKWSIPVYLFRPLDREKYVVIGINIEWEQNKKNR